MALCGDWRPVMACQPIQIFAVLPMTSLLLSSKKSNIYFENTTDTNQTMAEDKKFAVDKEFMEL